MSILKGYITAKSKITMQEVPELTQYMEYICDFYKLDSYIDFTRTDNDVVTYIVPARLSYNDIKVIAKDMIITMLHYSPSLARELWIAYGISPRANDRAYIKLATSNDPSIRHLKDIDGNPLEHGDDFPDEVFLKLTGHPLIKK